jgi:hypothetical protein
VCLGVKSRVRIIGGSTRFYHGTRTVRTTRMDSRPEGEHTGRLCNTCQKINIYEMLLSMTIRVKNRGPIEVTQFSDFPEDIQPYRHCRTVMDIKSTYLDCGLCFLIWNGWKAAAMEDNEMKNESLFSTPDSDTDSVDSDSSDEKIEPALAKVALEPVYIRIMECGNGKGANKWLDRSPRLYASCGLDQKPYQSVELELYNVQKGMPEFYSSICPQDHQGRHSGDGQVLNEMDDLRGLLLSGIFSNSRSQECYRHAFAVTLLASEIKRFYRLSQLGFFKLEIL